MWFLFCFLHGTLGNPTDLSKGVNEGVDSMFSGKKGAPVQPDTGVGTAAMVDTLVAMGFPPCLAKQALLLCDLVKV